MALLLLLLATLLYPLQLTAAVSPDPTSKVCVIGGGIAGASVAHFLKQYSCDSGNCIEDIRILERSADLGGRMATVTIGNDTFEAGASIIHPKNLHAVRFASLLNLTRVPDDTDSDDSWFGIWGGSGFVFKTVAPPPHSSPAIVRKIYGLINSFLIFRRYGFSLLRMTRFVKKLVDRFLLFYSGFETRPVFETVEEMLKWSGLYELTQRTLQEELIDAGLSKQLISELITVITRINYGQSVSISGLAGAVSLAGSDAGLWSVSGGNWQLAAGMIENSKVTLNLHEDINSISNAGGYYVLNSANGNNYNCEITVIATPLDELNITITPPVLVPDRRLQHTFTTFVRGLLNHKYFGLDHAFEVPDLIGTLEVPDVPFSSISVLKKYSEDDKTYKVFSRSPLEDGLLDLIFSKRIDTLRIDWPAYPHFEAPEVFAPIVLDGMYLYYINSFENAASTIECSAVAAENVARLIISRSSGFGSSVPRIKMPASDQRHLDL